MLLQKRRQFPVPLRQLPEVLEEACAVFIWCGRKQWYGKLLAHVPVWIDEERVNDRACCYIPEHPSHVRRRFVDDGPSSIKQRFELYACIGVVEVGMHEDRKPREPCVVGGVRGEELEKGAPHEFVVGQPLFMRPIEHVKAFFRQLVHLWASFWRRICPVEAVEEQGKCSQVQAPDNPRPPLFGAQRELASLLPYEQFPPPGNARVSTYPQHVTQGINRGVGSAIFHIQDRHLVVEMRKRYRGLPNMVMYCHRAVPPLCTRLL